MCKMLLSIKPEHVENILNESKKFEFRKVRCRSDVDKIIIYATHPIMKIVGEVDVTEVIVDAPEKVWKLTSGFAGISKQFYDKYYYNKKVAVAYQLADAKKYEEPMNLADFGINFAPQSFVYV